MLTRTGWGAIGAGVVLVLIAAVAGYMPFAVIGGAAVLAPLISTVWVIYRPTYVVERALRPVRVTVGEPARAELKVVNSARRRSMPMFAAEHVNGDEAQLAVPSLAVGDSFLTTYPLPTGRRSVVDVGPLVLNRADPFGMIRADQSFGDTSRLYVHPRTHHLAGMPASLERSFDGQTADAASGAQVFHALRDYVAGDDRRLIHWKSSARMGTLMVREHVDTTLPDLIVVLDVDADRQTDGSFEESVEVVASIASACVRASYPVTIRTSAGATIDAHGHRDQATHLLDALAAVQRSGSADLVAVLQTMQRSRRGLALVAVAAGLTTPAGATLTQLTSVFRTVIGVDLQSGGGTASPRGVQLFRSSSAAQFANQWNGGRAQ